MTKIVDTGGYYYININTTDNGSYTLLLPMPKDTRINILDGITISKGTADLHVVNTTYGKALEVKSNTSLIIEKNWNVRETFYDVPQFSSRSSTVNYSFSTINSTTNKAWVSCEKPANTSIKIMMESNSGYTSYSYGTCMYYAIFNWTNLENNANDYQDKPYAGQGDPFYKSAPGYPGYGFFYEVPDMYVELGSGWQQISVNHDSWWIYS
ncbi:MAG: hypothetical protein WC974_08130 [Thermoplasmata archaeon]